MNTDKLVKAIQIIVKEELKVIVPKLVKEGVKREMKNILRENKELRKNLVKTQKTQEQTFMNESLVEQNNVNPQRQLSKNPALNEVLNQTTGFNESKVTPSYQGESNEVESKTISINSNTAMGGLDAMRAQMAAKMGLPHMSMGSQPTGVIKVL